MELKLENGRYVPGAAGGLETVSGREETLQRILMRLQAKKGAFPPLPDYGSRLHTLGTVKPSAREAAAKQFVFEALEGEDAEIKSVSYCPTGSGAGRVTVELYTGDAITIEA